MEPIYVNLILKIKMIYIQLYRDYYETMRLHFSSTLPDHLHIASY